MTMLSRIEHSSTTLLAVDDNRNNSEITFLLFAVSALNHYNNLYLRADIYRRGIDNYLKKLNAYNSTSCAVNWGISYYTQI